MRVIEVGMEQRQNERVYKSTITPNDKGKVDITHHTQRKTKRFVADNLQSLVHDFFCSEIYLHKWGIALHGGKLHCSQSYSILKYNRGERGHGRKEARCGLAMTWWREQRRVAMWVWLDDGRMKGVKRCEGMTKGRDEGPVEDKQQEEAKMKRGSRLQHPAEWPARQRGIETMFAGSAFIVEGVYHLVCEEQKTILTRYLIHQLKLKKETNSEWNVFNAKQNVRVAWDEVTSTIANCFRKAGIGTTEEQACEDDTNGKTEQWDYLQSAEDSSKTLPLSKTLRSPQSAKDYSCLVQPKTLCSYLNPSYLSLSARTLSVQDLHAAEDQHERQLHLFQVYLALNTSTTLPQPTSCDFAVTSQQVLEIELPGRAATSICLTLGLTPLKPDISLPAHCLISHTIPYDHNGQVNSVLVAMVVLARIGKGT
ncbi:hypothetical protein PR048_004130 [Dryococelus australis]|uniref:Uncharacterized protein n=1 Tax=Dryococelus australis TaxID=614101 RepID=A0ABQ9I4L6_9NEOP|nr:hypothetical protein PR048_004130 [Dryococelus australis]